MDSKHSFYDTIKCSFSTQVVYVKCFIITSLENLYEDVKQKDYVVMGQFLGIYPIFIKERLP